MSAISLEFLGTGTSQGVPVIGCNCSVCMSSDRRDQRLRSSAVLRTQSTTVALDCGPDFRQQMLRAGCDHLDAVVLTHEHMDHVSGLDDLRALQFKQRKPTTIYCTELVEYRLRQQFAYAFLENPYPGSPRFEVERIVPDRDFFVGGVRWTPLPVKHGGGEVLGFRVGDVAYVTDASFIPDSTLEKMCGLEILVLNALRVEPHYSHFHLAEAQEMAHRLAATHTYFTHISHHLGQHGAIDQDLPPGMALAFDGLIVSTPA
jgi:phosphoribosyl 1,2-cyclic phosphate phosphodiesterase